MSYKTYILYSKKLSKYYVGITGEEIETRIERHNESSYGNHRFTSRAKDWELYLIFDCKDNKHALRLEKKIKSMKSRVYIENLKKYKELQEKILCETLI